MRGQTEGLRERVKMKIQIPGLLTFLFLIVIVSSAPAAENTAAESGAEPVAAEPVAIAVGKITREAESVDDWLRTIRESLGASRENTEVSEELGKIREEIRDGEKKLDGMMARRMTPDGLKSLRIGWKTVSERINQQVEALEEQIERFEHSVKLTEDRNQLWQLTLKGARKESAPAAIIARANTILRELKQQARELKKERNRVLDFQNQAAGLQKSVDQILERIESEQERIDTEIFARQNPPVWRLSAADGPLLEEQFQQAFEVLDELRAETAEYLIFNLDSLINYGLCIVFIGWFFSRRREILTRRYAGGGSDAELPPVIAILRYPWSAAVLLGILLSSFFFPGAVVGFKLLKGVVGVPVWLRVVRGTMPSALLGPLILIALVAIIDICRTGFGGVGLLNRVMLALIFLGGIVAASWLQRMRWRRHVRQTRINGFWFGVVSVWVSLSQATVFAGLAAVLVGYTLFADRLVSLVVWGSIIGSAFLALIRLLESVIQSLVDDHYFDRVRMIERNSSLFMEIVRAAIRGLGFCTWFYMVFRGLRIWDPFANHLLRVLNAELGRAPVTFSIGDLLAFGLTLWISWMLARFMTFVLDEEVFSRVRLGAGVPFAITTFTRYTILVAGFVSALGILGFPLDKITLLLSALGVGIGFGLQNITNNFISGVILLFERPIRVGDKVQLDDLIGTVTSIGIRASKIRGFDGADVIVPNGDFISTRVTNWTLADQQRRIILPVHVAYGTDPRQVLELLNQVALDNHEVLRSPAPEALFRGFGADALNFELRAWTESERGWPAVMSDLALATSDALKTAGIVIPLPQRELTLNQRTLAHGANLTAAIQPTRPG